MIKLVYCLPNTTTTQHGPNYMDNTESWKVLCSDGGIVAEIMRDWHDGSMAYCIYRNGDKMAATDTLADAVFFANVCKDMDEVDFENTLLG